MKQRFSGIAYSLSPHIALNYVYNKAGALILLVFASNWAHTEHN